MSVLKYYKYQDDAIEKITETLLYKEYMGFNKAHPINGFLLCDEMGCGKTIQSFGVLSQLKSGPILIVAPSACISVWNGPDYQKYFNNAFNMFTVDTYIADREYTSTDIILMTYSSIRMAFGEYVSTHSLLTNDELIRLCKTYKKVVPTNPTRKSLLALLNNTTTECKRTKKHEIYKSILGRRYGVLIMDEVHRMKNGSSKTTKAVSFIDRQYSLGLSGTPMMNHGGELLNIMWYALQLYNVEYSTIRNNPNGVYCKSLISLVSLGRLKRDLHELDFKRNKHEECVVLDWNCDKQRADYVRVKQSAIETIDKKLGEVHVLAKLQKLRQICIHSIGAGPSVKMLYFYDMYTQYSGETKLLCVSTYKTFLQNVMSPWLTSKNVSHVIFCGNGKKNQQKALLKFSSDPLVRVMLVVKQAGALGLNLQHEASVVVLMDPHYNESLDEQMVQRVDRIGQKKQVIIRKLFMKGSIDEAILEMQQKKQVGVDSWLSRNDSASTMEIYSLFLKEKDTV